jgi:hypothetical protein
MGRVQLGAPTEFPDIPQGVRNSVSKRDEDGAAYTAWLLALFAIRGSIRGFLVLVLALILVLTLFTSLFLPSGGQLRWIEAFRKESC